MKRVCPDCAASNPDAAKFCNECGASLGGAASPPPPESPAPPGGDAATARGAAGPGVDAASLARSITHRSSGLPAGLEELYNRRRADIMFVLDCTASMGGEIDAIRDAFVSFAESIQKEGVRARVGLVEFRDRLNGEEHRALLFDGEPFTSDPAAFRREVSQLRAAGGGDEPESSLDALLLALRQPFADGASKVLVLVTDAPPHVPDREVRSLEEVSAALRASGVQQLYLVIRTQDPRSQLYLKLFEGAGTRGLAFELGRGDDFRTRADDFRRTLMSLGKTISSATR